jgi:hypothetical protein
VYIPENRRNKRIKKSLELAFEDFKINTIRVFMQATKADDTDLNTIKKLTDMHAFKKHYAGEQWDKVVAGLSHNKKLVHIIIQNLITLRRDFLFSLYNADISDNEMYYLIKNSAQSLSEFTYMEAGVDEEDLKELMGFLWKMFTKSSWVHTPKE